MGVLPGGAGRRLLRSVRGGTARGAVSGAGFRCRVLGEVSTRAWAITSAGVTSPAPGDVQARALRGWGPGRAAQPWPAGGWPHRPAYSGLATRAGKTGRHAARRIPGGCGGVRGGPMGESAAGHLPVMVDEVLG